MDRPQLFLLSANAKLAGRLRKVLKKQFSVVCFTTASDFLNELKSTIPSGVVMDLSVEDMPPFNLIDKVRNSPVTRNLSFVLVSRDSDKKAIELAVRAGVSHFVGIPFENAAILEKIRMALQLEGSRDGCDYFSLRNEQAIKLGAYGRISYISKEGIHLECRLNPPIDAHLHLVSPLSKDLALDGLEVVVKKISRDVYYNYPFAIDAEWKTEEQKKKIGDWIAQHRHLNSPKKSKILFVGYSQEDRDEFVKEINQTHYSIRFATELQEALDNLPFLKVRCVVVKASLFRASKPALQKSFQSKLVESNTKWILVEDPELSDETEVFETPPLQSPDSVHAVVLSIEQNIPIPEPDPNRLYFSKTLEDSRVKIFFHGKTLRIGEFGCELALEYEIAPPGNFQLDLKALSTQNLRNPYVRAWPPARKLSAAESDNGKFQYGVYTHFLGIDDHQGQALRLFVRAAEMQEKQDAIAAITPVMGEPIEKNEDDSKAPSLKNLGESPMPAKKKKPSFLSWLKNSIG